MIRRRTVLKSGYTYDQKYEFGVYAYYRNGRLATYEEADAGAIGVAVIGCDYQFVIDKNDIGESVYFSDDYTNLSNNGLLISSYNNSAETDFKGYLNTEVVIETLSNCLAVQKCREKFSGHGHLGGLGEWKMTYYNKDAVDSMMTKIGGTAIDTTNRYLSSTLYDNTQQIWSIYYGTGTTEAVDRNVIGLVRPFLKIDVPVVDYVDLGYGTVWTIGNLCMGENGYYMGTSTQRGHYFTWGNITGRAKGDPNYSYTEEQYNNTPGSSAYGSIAKDDTQHDAALAALGYDYCLPTCTDFQNLITYCDKIYIYNYNNSGRNGAIYKSKVAGYTGNCIFLGYFGSYHSGTLSSDNSGCGLWSQSGIDQYNYGCYFYTYGSNRGSSYENASTCNKYYGYQIRAIKQPVVEYVDLDLPSGLLWAKYNVGATTETGYGNYYKFGAGAIAYPIGVAPTGYANDWEYTGYYDTATMQYGNGWRMPSRTELQELLNNTNKSYTTINGVNGYRLASKTDDSKYIFIPNAGYYNTSNSFKSNKLMIWSATSTYNQAYYMYSCSGVDYIDRNYAYSIRAVHNPM